MKYYNKKFWKSDIFYSDYYLPDVSLSEHCIRKNALECWDPQEEAIETINSNFISNCKDNLNEDVYYYDELIKYLLDSSGEFKPLNEYTFFKLRYYSTKFLNHLNESYNFFKEELKKFEEGGYNQALVDLSNEYVHDLDAIFEYKNKTLRIRFRLDTDEKIYEFYGVEKWEEKKFMQCSATLMDYEVYEESEGKFAYNTLWQHVNAEENGLDYSEMTINFTDLCHIK